MDRTEADASWQVYVRDLGHRIQQLRTSSSLSQERVAYRAGLSRYTYQKFEKGESRPGMPANPSIRSLMAIAQALDVDLQSVLPPNPPDLTAR